jgi:hypothetical protein
MRPQDLVWGLIASMYLDNVVGLVLVLTTLPIFDAILRVPFAAVVQLIVVSCAIAAYAIQNAIFDIWLLCRSGIPCVCPRRLAQRRLDGYPQILLSTRTLQIGFVLTKSTLSRGHITSFAKPTSSVARSDPVQ